MKRSIVASNSLNLGSESVQKESVIYETKNAPLMPYFLKSAGNIDDKLIFKGLLNWLNQTKQWFSKQVITLNKLKSAESYFCFLINVDINSCGICNTSECSSI